MALVDNKLTALNKGNPANSTGRDVVDAVNNSIDEIVQLQSKSTTTDQEILDIQNDVASNQTSIANVENRITITESDISDLDTRITTAENNIITNDSDITQLQTDLSQLETDVTNKTHDSLVDKDAADQHPASSISTSDGLTSELTHTALRAALKSQGYTGVIGSFTAGFTVNNADDLGVTDSGVLWQYEGSDPLPLNVSAGTVPSNPDWSEVVLNDHTALTNRNAVGAHDDIYTRNFNTVTDLRNQTDSSGHVGDLSQLSGSKVFWRGYYAESDGGDNWGIVKVGDSTSLIDDGGSVFVINNEAVNGVWVEAKPDNFKQFGAFPNQKPADYTSNIINALNYSAERIHSGEYLLTQPIEIKSNLSVIGGVAIFDVSFTAAENSAVTCNGEFDVERILIDCTNTSTITTGYQHNLEFTPTRRIKSDVTVKNVTNTDNTKPAYGCLYVVGSGATNNSINIEIFGHAHNITATANGVVGDVGGKAAGIHVSINKAGMVNYCKLIRNEVSKIYPSEDGDGIHIFAVDNTNENSKSIYEIVRPKISDCAKRGIKSQAPNCKTVMPFIDIDLNDNATTSANSYQSLAVNNTLSEPHVVGTNTISNSDGSISASNKNFVLEQPLIKVAAGQNLIRLETGAENYSVRGGNIEVSENHPSADFSHILVEGGASGVIDIENVVNTANTGTAVRYSGCSGVNRLRIKNGNGQHLVRWTFCTGTFVVDDACSDDGLSDTIFRIQGTGGEYIVKHSVASTTGPSICTSEAAVQFVGEGVLSSLTNGILYTGTGVTGRKVTGNWVLTSTSGTGKGIDAAGTVGGDFTGCETSGYSTHIDVGFSDKTRVCNNLGRGAGTHVVSTSATNYVDYNNNIVT